MLYLYFAMSRQPRDQRLKSCIYTRGQIVNISRISRRLNRKACARRAIYCIRSITCIIIKYVLAGARDEICNVLDLHIFCICMKRCFAMVKAWIIRISFLCWYSFHTAYHKTKVLAVSRNEICNALDLHTFS